MKVRNALATPFLDDICVCVNNSGLLFLAFFFLNTIAHTEFPFVLKNAFPSKSLRSFIPLLEPNN